jgi:hypothetical protein
MPKPAVTRRLRKERSAELVAARRKLRSLELLSSRGLLTTDQEIDRSDLYRKINELKVFLLKLGFDPNMIGKKVRKVGSKRPGSSVRQKKGISSGGTGVYSLGPARKTWK